MMATTGATTTAAAEALAEELSRTGHEITRADLLDCLASAGLVLVRDPDTAARAYSEHILWSLGRAA